MSWHLFVSVLAYALRSQLHLAEVKVDMGPNADLSLADSDAEKTEAGKQ